MSRKRSWEYHYKAMGIVELEAVWRKNWPELYPNVGPYSLASARLDHASMADELARLMDRKKLEPPVISMSSVTTL
jgi:hypothetical protein